MKAGADFEQRDDAAAQDGAPAGRFGDAREDFQQRGFARAVAADDADDFAGIDREGDVLQRPERVRLRAVAVVWRSAPWSPPWPRVCGRSSVSSDSRRLDAPMAPSR